MKKDEIISVLYDLYKITGFRTSLHDTNFVEIAAYPSEKLSLCSIIHQSPGEYERCHRGDEEAFRRVKETGETVIYKCRYGLTEAVSPLYNFGILTGYLMMGQVLDDKTDKEVCRSALSHLENEEVIRIFNELAPIRADMIDSYVNVMTVCARYLTLSNALPGAMPSITETAITYINENVDKRITIKELCAITRCSKTTLISAFKRDFGKTITEAVNDAKLAEARRLLKSERDMSLNAIAHATGFYDQAYFSKVFSAAFGMTPSAYRKESAE